MQIANHLKGVALNLLLDETFSYIEKTIYDAHVIIAQKNALEQNRSASFFMYNGDVYPTRTKEGLSTKGLSIITLPLHYSLYADFDQCKHILEKADYTSIKNFFSIVLSHSFNNIVLDKFLPTVLITRLRREFSDGQYYAINFGTTTSKPFESIEVTKESIAHISEHYKDTIASLRNLLMERFLLQE